MITVWINNRQIDTSDDGVGFRLNRIVESATNFGQKGGTFSTTIKLPYTRNNANILPKAIPNGRNRFNSDIKMLCELKKDGLSVFKGIFRLLSVSLQGFEGEISGEDGMWIGELGNKKLTELGYVNGKPTWLVPFDGMKDTWTICEQDISQTDIQFPTIRYNNTLVSDLDELPNINFDDLIENVNNAPAYPTRFYGTRFGLTYDDFPPAPYYKTVLQRCFDEIGYKIEGDVIDEPWFEKLIMPYVGEGYQWNFKTLAQLYADLEQNSGFATDSLQGDFDEIAAHASTSPFLPFASIVTTLGLNALTKDDVDVRIDRIANFKRFNVESPRPEYTCPVNGRYKIRLKSSYRKQINCTNEQNNHLNSLTETGYNDVCVIMRANEFGEYPLNPNVFFELSEFMDGGTAFLNNPSDVIAFFSPRNATAYFPSSARAIGSPLTNNQEPVILNSFSYNVTFGSGSPHGNENVSTNYVDMEIELDMLKNERIRAFWFTFSYVNTVLPNGNSQIQADANIVDSELYVDYLCGEQDIDVATNLPDISVKDFVGGFLNTFNLSFNTVENSNTIKFISNGIAANPIDLTQYIDANTVVLKPVGFLRSSMTVGYDNDATDRLLTTVELPCEGGETFIGNNYANVVYETDNIYVEEGDKKTTNGFSATKFELNELDLLNINAPILPTLNTQTGGTPSRTLVVSMDFGTTDYIAYDIPVIQSLESFNQTKGEQLNYSWDYTPRIVYYLGSKRQVYGGSYGKIKVNGFEQLVYNTSNYQNGFIPASVCAFDLENGSLLPTLRFDGDSGLFKRYIGEQGFEQFEDTHVLECNAYINTPLFKSLNSNRFVSYSGAVWRILEIMDFDLTGRTPAKIKMIKL